MKTLYNAITVAAPAVIITGAVSGITELLLLGILMLVPTLVWPGTESYKRHMK